MSGTAYKALGFVVWKGGMWYLRRRYGGAGRVGAGALMAAGAAAAAVAVLVKRRNGSA
jgi:hypothetical protein